MRASLRLLSLSLLAASVVSSRASAQRPGAFAHVDSVVAEELLRTKTPGTAARTPSPTRHSTRCAAALRFRRLSRGPGDG